MLGSKIIEKIGVDQIHCSIEKEIFDIDPGQEYVIIKGTDESPRVVCKHHQKMIELGKYTRLRIENNEIINDVEWTTGHNTFEGDVEPKHSPKRPDFYTTQ